MRRSKNGALACPDSERNRMLMKQPNLSFNPDASPAALARRPLGAG
jgi:hypothetical protein